VRHDTSRRYEALALGDGTVHQPGISDPTKGPAIVLAVIQ